MQLMNRFEQLWERLGVTHIGVASSGFDLALGYNEKHRAYHNVDHLKDVLQKLDWAKTALEKTGEVAHLHPAQKQRLFDIIEMALWYHDVVYDAKAKDNEAQSRDLFLKHASRLGLDPQVQKDVARLIDLTAQHTKASTLDERIMTDCDLAILGAPAAAFKKYDDGIRKEYVHVPEDIYNAVRPQVLATFLNQSEIFKTKAFRASFEDAARKNLSAAIAPQPTKKQPKP